MFALLVTGDREATATAWGPTLVKAFAATVPDDPDLVLIDGDCRGIDRLARQIAVKRYGFQRLKLPALWDTEHKAAGPRRNARMVAILALLREGGYVTKVLAFHDDLSASTGTRDCVKRAAKAGFAVDLYDSAGDVVELPAAFT